MNHVGGPPKDSGALNVRQAKGRHELASDANAVRDLVLTFAGCSRVPRAVELRRVDFEHANALALWYGPLNAAPYPNATALAALQNASEIVVERIVASGTAAAVSIALPALPSFAVSLVSFVC